MRIILFFFSPSAVGVRKLVLLLCSNIIQKTLWIMLNVKSNGRYWTQGSIMLGPDVCCHGVQEVSLWHHAVVQSAPGCLTCSLAAGLCHPSCSTSLSRIKGSTLISMQSRFRACSSVRCSSVSVALVWFFFLSVSIQKHLKPGQVLQFVLLSHYMTQRRNGNVLGCLVVVRAQAGLNIGLVSSKCSSPRCVRFTS